ncbi:MAG: hypothetical protein KAW52_04190, partial [candidate division Zixibacteria bacterium]|nr:hypothetical protein [candidate division Zixibacteria bacterium]
MALVDFVFEIFSFSKITTRFIPNRLKDKVGHGVGFAKSTYLTSLHKQSIYLHHHQSYGDFAVWERENFQRIERIHRERIHRERIKRIRWGKILTLQRIKMVSLFWILRSERGLYNSVALNKT